MSVSLEVRTLGSYRLLAAGEPLPPLGSRTADALLVYLMHQRRPMAREVLADFFWDERDSQRAAANLRTLLTLMRKALGDFLEVDRRTVAFRYTSDYWWDLEIFEKEMDALQPILAQAKPLSMDEMERLHTVLELVQGEFLEGFHLNESRGFEEWMARTQNQVRRVAENGLVSMVEACMQHREYGMGIDYADRLLAFDPYNEEIHRKMMWFLARSGRRAAALTHFESCRGLLAEELGVAPDEDTTATYERIRNLPAAPPRKLPPEPTPFVGRAGEPEEIARLLFDPHCRLLTLLGPGGMGKTRLAMRAASHPMSESPGAFLDGIYFVQLSSAGSAGAFAATVADALGLHIGGHASPADLLRDHLQTREILLVLDSVEYLASDEEFIQQLIELLNHAPQVKLLVTSRVRLNLREEWIYDVGGLDFPAETESETGARGGTSQPEAGSEPDVMAYGAGALFFQHASRYQRLFAPDAGEIGAIAQICRLLDGQPLGLELAAAWTRTHSCATIARRIADDLDFLDTTLHNVPARQRSLRAVFDYSWSLLSGEEQLAMQRLSVFAGPVDPHVAHKVAQVSTVEMMALADKSLLRRIQSEDGIQLYSIHDSVRQYALEKLSQIPQLDGETWLAYCRFYAELAATAAPQLHGEDQLEAEERLHRARDNLRATWAVAIERGWWWVHDAMLDGYYWYLWRRSEMYEARALFDMIFPRPGSSAPMGSLAASAVEGPPELLLARLQKWMADTLYWLGDYEQSRALIPQIEQTLRRLDAWGELAWLCDIKGQLEYQVGNYGPARQYMEEALRYFHQVESHEGIAHTLCALANVLCDGYTDYDGARDLYIESLSLYQRSGDRYGQAKLTINLGALTHSLGNPDQAIPYYEKGIALCRTLNHRQTLAIVLNNMGQAQKAVGNLAGAIPYLDESAQLRRELRDLRGLAFTLMSLANAAAARNDFENLCTHAIESLQLGLRLGSPAILAELLVMVADILIDHDFMSHAALLLHAVLAEELEGNQLLEKARGQYERLPHQYRQQAPTQPKADARQPSRGAKRPSDIRRGGESLPVTPLDIRRAANQAIVWLGTSLESTSPSELGARVGVANSITTPPSG